MYLLNRSNPILHAETPSHQTVEGTYLTINTSLDHTQNTQRSQPSTLTHQPHDQRTYPPISDDEDYITISSFHPESLLSPSTTTIKQSSLHSSSNFSTQATHSSAFSSKPKKGSIKMHFSTSFIAAAALAFSASVTAAPTTGTAIAQGVWSDAFPKYASTSPHPLPTNPLLLCIVPLPPSSPY
jgi:hypothetical protein